MSARSEAWSGLQLADPWMLLLALALPLALWARARRGEPALLFAPLALLPVGGAGLPGTWRVRLRGLPTGLEVLCLLCVVAALARPVEREILPRVRAGLEILLVLDVSSSMAARDLDPARTRLELARAAAAEFSASRPQDRIGLLTFARYPDLVTPPTLDQRALEELLAAVEPVEPEGPEDATGIGAALARAVQVLAGVDSPRATARAGAAPRAPAGAGAVGARDGAEERPARVVILLTDGEENVAGPRAPREIAPLAAAQLAAREGVRVYAIAAGIGNPDGEGGFAPLDTAPLAEVARLTGGRFFEARDAGALTAIYERIDELETVEQAEPQILVHERFAPFLLAGLALLLAGRLLRSTLLGVLP